MSDHHSHHVQTGVYVPTPRPVATSFALAQPVDGTLTSFHLFKLRAAAAAPLGGKVLVADEHLFRIFTLHSRPQLLHGPPGQGTPNPSCELTVAKGDVL